MVTFDTSFLLSYYQSRAGVTGASAAGASTAATKTKYAPTAPWDTKSTAPRASELVKQVLAGRSFVNEGAAQLDLKGASDDYRKLFALYQGLNTLYGLTESASARGVSDLDLSRYQKLFTKGLSQVGIYADGLSLDQIRLTRGDTMLTDKAKIGVPKAVYSYKSDTLLTGTVNDPVPSFEGDAAFSLTVKRQGVTKTVDFDLDDMGSTPRSMANVVNYLNGKLKDEGVTTRFAIDRTTAQPRTITAGGKTITLPAVGDALALKVNSDSAEQISFSAVSKPAVYVTTYAGDPDPDKNTKTDDAVYEGKLLKLDPSAAGVDSRIKTETLEGTLGAVRQTQVGPDGSLYMIADVDKSVDGQAVKGSSDVALLKYDNAGKLLYARTLGAADQASGLALTVADDGRVAIAGSVTGEIQGATNGPLNSTAVSGKSDSFVTVFDAKGDETWTMRRGAQQEDEATAVAFGDDGVVYVGGRTKSVLPNGGGQSGGWDSYVTAYAADSKGAPKALWTKQFGTAGQDGVSGLAVDGDRLLVAGSEDGHAVVRSFDTSTTTTKTTRSETAGVLTLTVETYKDGVLQGSNSTNYAGTGKDFAPSSTSYTSAGSVTDGDVRDLGDLKGGAVAGLVVKDGKIWVAGNTRNDALAIDDVANAHAGAMDAFAASISTDLTSHAEDHLTYYGGAGDNTVAGFAVSGGKVYVTGSAGADLPGLSNTGKKEGYVAALDVQTGAVSSAQRITGKDGIATATSIAVDDRGASDLDKFGLPSGLMDFSQSTKIVSATSARAGDQFQIRTREGAPPTTVTLAANDTLETFAAKIRSAAGYHAKVSIVSDGDQRTLKIEPANASSTVEILPGKTGKNLLDALGLADGIARKTTINDDGKSVPTAPGGNIYGIGLDLDLDLSNKDAIKNAQQVLMNALTKIRNAYKDLEDAAKPKSASSAKTTSSGAVPAYLSAQIANYQAGLDRLGGGG